MTGLEVLGPGSDLPALRGLFDDRWWQLVLGFNTGRDLGWVTVRTPCLPRAR